MKKILLSLIVSIISLLANPLEDLNKKQYFGDTVQERLTKEIPQNIESFVKDFGDNKKFYNLDRMVSNHHKIQEIENLDETAKKFLHKYNMSYKTTYKDIDLEKFEQGSEIYKDMNKLQGFLFKKAERDSYLKSVEVLGVKDKEYKKYVDLKEEEYIKAYEFLSNSKTVSSNPKKKTKQDEVIDYINSNLAFILALAFFFGILGHSKENKPREV